MTLTLTRDAVDHYLLKTVMDENNTGHENIIYTLKTLIQHKANVDFTDIAGNSSLMLTNDSVVSRFLIDLGTSVKQTKTSKKQKTVFCLFLFV